MPLGCLRCENLGGDCRQALPVVLPGVRRIWARVVSKMKGLSAYRVERKPRAVGGSVVDLVPGVFDELDGDVA